MFVGLIPSIPARGTTKPDVESPVTRQWSKASTNSLRTCGDLEGGGKTSVDLSPAEFS